MNPKLKSKVDVIKKVLAYTSLDIDTSGLYSEMVLAASTSDPVQKKMVYHYLCHYARSKPDLAMMCINTLQKDCRDQDPMISGLALRSLCSLRLPELSEYAMVSLRQGLKHASPYVRKTAILCCAKIFSILPKLILDGDLVDVLYSMLRDSDPQVVSNAVLTLNEILASEGGMAINSKLMLYLLNRLHEFSEWGQCSIMELACRYTPTSQDELYDILNLLESRLKHANSAVVITTTKLFLHLTSDQPELKQQVLNRMITPLITHMSVGGPDIAFSVLSHIKVIVNACEDRSTWGVQFKNFFSLHADSIYVRQLKMDVLALIATPTNAHEIVFELAEYVSSRSEMVATHAVRTIALVAIRVPIVAGEAVDALLQLLETAANSSNASSMTHIATECLVACRDLLRKYPQRYVDILPAIQALPDSVAISPPVEKSDRSGIERGSVDKDVTTAILSNITGLGSINAGRKSGRAAFAWMLGEFGDNVVENAPYILEDMLNTWESDTCAEFRIELVAALVKLFFKRPAETRAALGRALSLAVADEANISVRDRGMYYYRLLKSGDLRAANAVVNAPKSIIESFIEDSNASTNTTLLKEFNTFSVIYGVPQDKFPVYKHSSEDDEEEEVAGEQNYELEEALEESNQDDQVDNDQTSHDMPLSVFNDEHHESENENEDDFLEKDSTIDPDTFQTMWGDLPDNEFEFELQAEKVSELETSLNNASIYTMASGEAEPGVAKYFLYAKLKASSHYVLLELTVEDAGSVQGIVKTSATPDEASTFMGYFGTTLSPLL